MPLTLETPRDFLEIVVERNFHKFSISEDDPADALNTIITASHLMDWAYYGLGEEYWRVTLGVSGLHGFKKCVETECPQLRTIRILSNVGKHYQPKQLLPYLYFDPPLLTTIPSQEQNGEPTYLINLSGRLFVETADGKRESLESILRLGIEWWEEFLEKHNPAEH